MPDSLALPAIALIAAALVALALVWPQGEGQRSPAPFGHSLPKIADAAPPSPPPLDLRGPVSVQAGGARGKTRGAPL